MNDTGAERATEPRLEVRRLSKSFAPVAGSNGRGLAVLSDVHFSAMPGEFVAIVGPSGCGKSTLFNIVAGLDTPTNGEVLIDGAANAPRLGRFGYMPQKDLLMPWRTALDNVVLGLEVQGMAGDEARRLGLDRLREFGLDRFAGNYPTELSGGIRQRVAFLRTLLTGKAALLLDEPFGALDALTRADMHEWLLDVVEHERPTILFITHDVEEAVLLSDKVIVLTESPGSVRDVVAVPLPRPRHYDVIAEPEFVRLKARVLSELRTRSAVARPAQGRPA